MMRKEPRQFPLKSPCDQVMDAEDAFIKNCLTMDGTTGKTNNNNTTPCDNAEKKTPSTKITNEILTEEELKKVTDNDEERSTAVNSETTLRSIATR